MPSLSGQGVAWVCYSQWMTPWGPVWTWIPPFTYKPLSAQVYFLSASKCPQLLLFPSTTVTPTLYSVLPDPFQALSHLLVFLEARCWRLSGWSMSSKMEMQTDRTDWCTRVEGGEEGEGETNGESRSKHTHYHMDNRQPVDICCVTQGAQSWPLWQPRGVGKGGGWGMFRRHMYTYG